MQVKNPTGGKPIKLWTDGVSVETEALEQIYNVSRLPFIHKWIAVMPDVHAGLGSTIGSVVATKGAVMPSVCGVDIGCGMMAIKTNLTAADVPAQKLPMIRKAIEKAVPHGRTHNGGPGDRGAWGQPRATVQCDWISHLKPVYKDLCDAHPELQKANSLNHLGTLGTGNHFIEVCLDKQDKVWLMLHSGSRGIGNKIGSHFIKLAKQECQRWFVDLPDPNLAFFPQGTQLFDEYMTAVQWAQQFAQLNRQIMMDLTVKAVANTIGQTVLSEFGVNCHHNFVQWENHYGENILVTRKGATSAREGQWGIIPGSMGARSFIVQGLGNPESFNSCSHGAGRLMSRTAAKKKFTLADHHKATEGIECKKDSSILDETPGCYKDICAVMEAQADLVKPVYELRQLICIKG